MGVEIERKFLINGDGWRSGTPIYYCQGYLNRDKRRTVRVRIAGNVAMLTVKSLTTGMSRAEYEYDIPMDDAKQILELCELPLIEKNRWLVPAGELTWEIDEFLGQNEGLIVAEIELESEEQTFERPEWIGKEVTEDHRYFNSNLSLNPFQTWN